MNLQCTKPTEPLRVLLVNPLIAASQMLASKLLSGSVFGDDQRVALILFSDPKELNALESLKVELDKCGFPCSFSISIFTEIPNITDADVFCFISNFSNPNSVNCRLLENHATYCGCSFRECQEHCVKIEFDLIMKLATNLKADTKEVQPIKTDVPRKNKKVYKEETKPRNPLIIVDGLSTMDILHSFSEGLPSDIFFCPTPLQDIATFVLADYLKVNSTDINRAYVWSADDEVFHLEIQKPIIKNDKILSKDHCYWDMINKHVLQDIGLDHNQMNSSWLLKEFIEKIKTNAKKNPYGNIYKASLMASALRGIWTGRNAIGDQKIGLNLGVISDGSVGTVKGLPYALPLQFAGNTWSVDTIGAESPHNILEIRRINKTASARHEQLISYCKSYLEGIVAVAEEFSTVYSSHSSSF